MNHYNEQEYLIGINNDIPAIFTTSEKKSNTAILMLHGLASNKNGYLEFYKNLAKGCIKSSIDTLRIDFRAHGESTSKNLDFTISSQISDTIAAIKELLKIGYSNISIFASSFGCYPALFVSSLFKEVINITLLCPVLDYHRTFFKPESEWGIETFSRIIEDGLIGDKEIPISDEISLHQRIIIEMLGTNISSIIPNKEITIFHGNNDGMVNYKISSDIASRFKNIKLNIIDNMEHGYTNKNDELGNHPNSLKNFNLILDHLINKAII